jgi:PAS domain S-box-containing protein
MGYTLRKLKDELKYNRLINSLDDLLWESDTEERIVFISSNCKKILGYPPDEIIGKKINDFMHPEEIRRVNREYQRAFSKLKPLRNFINILLKKNGNSIVMETNAVPVYDEKGTFTGYFGIDRDITSHIQAKKALSDNLQFMETLIDTIPLPAFYKGNDGRYLGFNKSFASEIIGLPAEEIIGKKLEELGDRIPDELAKAYSLKDNEMIDTPGTQIYEAPVKCADNKLRYFLFNKTTYCDASGRPAGIVGVMVDITERRESEKALTKLLEELDYSRRQIEDEAVRVIGLNEQLEESEKKLNELNASKDKLFSIIGHDLRGHFNVLNSMTQMLSKDYNMLSDEDRLECIGAIASTSRQSYKLLENLLNWARSQTGMMEFAPERLHLDQVISGIIGLLKGQAENKGISLSSSVPEQLMVKADRNMMETVLRNLISNAIKFTAIGGTIIISAFESEKSVKISVSDSGIGLSAEDIQKLFRIDVNNKEIGSSREKGTGLGLILCKEFIEKHNGTIWVESKPGRGSNFIFTLPKPNI